MYFFSTEEHDAYNRASFERFIEKLPNGGCWIWKGSLRGKGYGQFNSRIEPSRLAHRYSFRIANGDLPADKFVLHKCDNPRCVNPDHLFVGTCKDNSDDKIAKGRYRNAGLPGESNPKAKLSQAEVEAIRSDGRGSTVIAAEYHVNRSTIHRIRTGRGWSVR